MPLHYEESISFHPMIQALYLFLLGVGVWSVSQERGSSALPAVLLLLLLVALPLLFGRLRVRVDEEMLVAEFGFVGWPAKRVPLAEIVHARPVTYRPIRQFGGWGIRFGKHDGEPTGVYSVRGNTGVLLELSRETRVCAIRTRRFLLGSLTPERLAAALGKS